MMYLMCTHSLGAVTAYSLDLYERVFEGHVGQTPGAGLGGLVGGLLSHQALRALHHGQEVLCHTGNRNSILLLSHHGFIQRSLLSKATYSTL